MLSQKSTMKDKLENMHLLFLIGETLVIRL